MQQTVNRRFCALKGKDLALRMPGQDELMLQYIGWGKTEGRIPGDRMASVGYLCLIGEERGGRRYPPSPLIPAAKAAWQAGLQLMRTQREPPCMERYAKVTQPTSHLLRLNDKAEVDI